jgi:hypothetical protein
MNTFQTRNYLAFTTLIFLFLSTFIVFTLFATKATENTNTRPPWDWDTNCKVLSSNFEEATHYCRYSSSNEKGRIILIGDSHAASISEPMSQMAKRNQFSFLVYAFSGCLNVRDIKIVDSFAEYSKDFVSSCNKHNQSLKSVLNSYDPDIVVISQRSSLGYFSDSNVSSDIYRSEIIRGMTKLISSDYRLFYILPFPEAKPRTLLDHLFSRSRLQEVPWRESDLMEKTIPRNIEVISPSDLYRSKGYHYTSEKFIYDSNHPTFNGGDLVAHSIERLLTR